MKHSFKPSIFSEMTALAQQHAAINLAQGFPDFELDSTFGNLLKEAVDKGFNQYAPMAGLPLLRAAIRNYLERRLAVHADTDTEITITPGATYGIYTALAATLQPGDEVIVLEPAYDSYVPNILSLHAKPVLVPLLPDTFLPDWPRVQKAITPRTKAIIINTPHNPGGAVWNTSDFDALAELTTRTNITIISDEVYEQLVFDGRRHVSVLQHEALRAKAFVVFSFGKVFQNTGWKVGYVVAQPAHTSAFRQVHQYLAFAVNTPAQYALGTYLEAHPLLDMSGFLQQRRDLFLALMKGSGFTLHSPAAGSFFQVLGYKQLSSAADRDFAMRLIRESGVAAIPLSAFYQDGTDNQLLRFCFAKKEETLRVAAERLSSFR